MPFVEWYARVIGMKKLPTAKGLVIKKSQTGLGIFASKKYIPNETLFEVTGSRISGFEDEDIAETERNNLFRYSKEKYIAPKGRIGDYLNHSCKPNAYVKKIGKKLFIRAIEHILKGKEVTIDYSTITAADDSWTMRCRCGKASCRKRVQKFISLPKSLQSLYIQKNIVPSYILSL
jgi:hypothetical protein